MVYVRDGTEQLLLARDSRPQMHSMTSSATEKTHAATKGTGRREHAETGWRLLELRDLRWLWTGQAISQIGEGLNKVALLYLVYNLTNSTLMTTVIGVLQTLPPLILGPILGVYIDRFPKKWLMMGADTCRAGLALIIPLLYAANALTLPRVYIVVFLMAVVTTVFSPALSSTVPLIVERTQLTAANALVASTAMIGMLVGPAVSGLGIATVGMQVVLYVSSATFVLSVLSLSRLHLKQSRSQRAEKRKGGSFFKRLKGRLALCVCGAPHHCRICLSRIVLQLGIKRVRLLTSRVCREGTTRRGEDARVAVVGLWSRHGRRIDYAGVQPTAPRHDTVAAHCRHHGDWRRGEFHPGRNSSTRTIHCPRCSDRRRTRRVHFNRLGHAPGNGAGKAERPHLLHFQHRSHVCQHDRHGGLWMGDRSPWPADQPTRHGSDLLADGSSLTGAMEIWRCESSEIRIRSARPSPGLLRPSYSLLRPLHSRLT